MTKEQIIVVMEKFRDKFGHIGSCGTYFPKLEADEVINFFYEELLK